MVTVAADAAAKSATDGAWPARPRPGASSSIWVPIEDTVKANDPDTYVEIEDSMEQLQSGDATKVDRRRGPASRPSVTAYRRRYPG